ncbi:lipopolysaccharide biosynthesis protein [Butyrivibrio sp. AE3004]|uniref:lipopolysaccharide biosynthesis protein n=1 Tax=Butyrivibrio sp. AE3004 TaxID=1506994 RepID=UPI0004949A5A|nr:polysaccharide biosynthesis C-terminal domain-containing protein [Butyrivibrio sp. AE3004]
MGKQERLLKNTVILFIGGIGTKLINFLMLPLFTAWLSVEEYGDIDIFTVIIAMAVPILSLQLDQGVFRFLIDDDKQTDKKETISSCILIIFSILFTSNILAFLFLQLMAKEGLTIWLIALDLQIFDIMLQQIVRGMGNNKIYSWNSIIITFTNVLFSIVLIRFCGMGVIGYICAFCISHVVSIFYMIMRSKVYKLFGVKSFNVGKAKRILVYSIPMITNNVSWWILNASDKLILNVCCGNGANGIYAAAGKIPGLITTMYSLFHMAWQESASREKEDMADFYSDVFRNLFAIMSYILIILLCFEPVIFKILINDKFAAAYYHIPLLLVGMFFYSIAQYYGGIYIGLKKTKELGKTSIIAAGINLFVNILLVGKMQIFAASVSTLMAYFILFILRARAIKKICQIKYDYRTIKITIGIIILAMMGSYSRNILILLLILLGSTFIYYKLYYDVIKQVILKITCRLHIRVELS